MSIREGRGQPMIFCAASTTLWSFALSAMVQLPYQIVIQYVNRLSMDER